MERGKQSPPELWEMNDALKKSFGAKYCMAPHSWKSNCVNNIIKAHSVAKSWLRKIADNGHVYRWKGDLFTLKKTGGKIKPKLVGIGSASTFTGFCGQHDNDIFLPLEDAPFTGTPEQCFLLGYRAVAREMFTKKASRAPASLLKELDKGASLDEQIFIQSHANAFSEGVDAGYRDVETSKQKYDNILASKNFSDMNYYIIELDSVPDVMCSGGIFPECDFEGNGLPGLDNPDLVLDLMTFSSIPTATGGAIVFSWLNGSHANCGSFIDSLDALDYSKIPNAMIRLFFEFCENIFMSPPWWKGLSASEQQSLLDRLMSATMPALERSPTCLQDDGLNVVNWTVAGRKKKMS